MEDLLKEQIILVCDFEYFPLVFKLKSNYPEARWKILKKEELLDRVSFSFAIDPIPYLMKKGIDYSNAKKYLRLLRVADFEKNARLKELHNELKEKGYFKIDDLGLLELSSSKIALLEMQEDVEVHKLLERKGFNYVDLTLEELGAKKRMEGEIKPTIFSFPNKFAQYFYIYSQIRKEILEDESLKRRISVLINDESDLYYVNLASSLFKIPSYAVFLRPFLSDPYIKAKVSEIYKRKSFFFLDEEKKDPKIADLIEIIDYYGLASLSFDFAYASLLEIANTLGVKERIDDRGITIENRFNLSPEERIFVTNFQYDVFYKVFDDKNVLTDEELCQIDANPSFVKTKLDRRKKLNYITYNDIALLSRVRQHLTDKIYDSQFLEELGWDAKKDVIKMGMNESGVYTSEAGRLYLGDQLDKQFYRLPYYLYRSYDHSYKGIDEKVFDAAKNWSVTNLEGYILCPFKYYMEAVLPSYDDDKHAMWLGTLIHKVMENVTQEDFDFETEFEKGVEEYKKSMKKSRQEFGNKEKAWLKMTKYWLKKVAASLQKARIAGNIVDSLPETKITFTLSGKDGETYTFANAKIDKILVSECEGERFYTIIDYKSGKEKFEPTTVFLGRSTQLPFYYYAIENSKEKNDYTKGGTFGGFGIVHTYASSPKDLAVKNDEVSVELDPSFVKMNGLTKCYLPYWRSIDSSGITKKGQISKKGGNYYSGILFNAPDAEESIIKGCEITPPYNLNRLLEDGKKATVDAIEKILNNDFAIKPTSFNLCPKDLSSFVCSSCPYGDICYKNLASDGVSYEGTIDNYFYPEKMTNRDEMEFSDDE